MINRSLESFLRTTYGDAAWVDILQQAGVEQRDFLVMNGARDQATRRVVFGAARYLGKSPGETLEDMGAWMVRLESIRRLLRFSGPDFVEFVRSLDELPGRARMVLPDVPPHELTVVQSGPQDYRITAQRLPAGWIWALAGVLRGMADDYGTLALILVAGNWIDLSIALEEHAASRPFDLSPSRAGGTP